MSDHAMTTFQTHLRDTVDAEKITAKGGFLMTRKLLCAINMIRHLRTRFSRECHFPLRNNPLLRGFRVSVVGLKKVPSSPSPRHIQ